MKAIAIVAFIVLFMQVTTAAAAFLDKSANYYLSGCRSLLNEDTNGDAAKQGMCAGVMFALLDLAPHIDIAAGRSCPPRGVTAKQMLAVILRWLDQRPERWNENFVALASFALHDAWPCG